MAAVSATMDAEHCEEDVRWKEPMSYIEAHLVPGETVIYETRLHWIAMLGNLALGCLFGLTGMFLLYYASSQGGMEIGTVHLMEGGGVALLALGMVVVLMGMVQRNATEMALTNHRVVIKKGLVGRTTIEMLLNKVESIEVKEPAMGRMLGYGTIVVIGTGGTLEPFDRMTHPLEFRRQVQQQVEKLSN